ncbi:unnamed protein product [Somion occarium]|uniref:CID domain-containing protein n=1 Tax=Somion occarium TaxID=3059160 RepID=A0ABP1E4B1_9APHY
MSSLETFESTLKDVVQAKRLSQSKMKKLTDNALKCMKYDTQLVSTLYRTHKTLSTASKISSLYVFDALARAARHQVIKQDVKVDSKSEKGNCATFLLKIEGVLDGLFQDMASLDHPDARTKKILDIWVKSNTFPPDVLERLSKLVKEVTEQDSNKFVSVATADPRQQTTPPVAVPTPPQQVAASTPQLPAAPTATPTTDVQSTLLALLSQAANAVASNGQTTANTPAPVAISQLDANQLALFQQLAQSAKAGSAVPTQPLPLPVSLVPSATANVPPVAPPNGGPPQPYRDDHFGFGRRDPKYDRFDGPERARDRDDYYDDRRNFRGDFRGRFPRGGFRGRGAGRGRWDEREQYTDRNREREWNSPSEGRHSRSRSPPRNRFAGRRDVRPYSPPRRPSTSQMSGAPPMTPGPPTLTGRKDEFGRDLRLDSPTQATPPGTTPHQLKPPSIPISTSVVSVDSTEKPSQPILADHSASAQIESNYPVASSSSYSSTIPSVASQDKLGLDVFDLTTFNPMEPSSWEALGKAWAVTNGYLPSQEELMQYIMGGNMFPVTSQYGVQQQGDHWSGHEENWNRPQTNRGRGRGRGSFGHGNSRGGQWGYSGDRRGDDRGTDAVMLGGGEEMESSYDTGYEGAAWQEQQQQSGTWSNDSRGQSVPSEEDTSQAEHLSPTGGAPTGRMQRVGDKWVFVRGEAATTEVTS